MPLRRVQGISWTEFTVQGVSNHAGTTPMRMRHDAGYVACAIVNYARDIARSFGGDQAATVGAINLAPNLVNVIPYQAIFTVDLRNTDEAILQEAERNFHAFAREVAAAEGVTRRTVRWSGLSRWSLIRTSLNSWK